MDASYPDSRDSGSVMDSKDGGQESPLGPSEFGGMGGVSNVSLHKHWGYVYGRQSEDSGNE